MNTNVYNSEEFRIALVAVLAALLLAANEVSHSGIQGLLSIYAYWFARILIESTLFVATLYAIEQFVPANPRPTAVYASSILISLITFTLAITSLDLIVGLPELGLNESDGRSITRFQAFGLELFYLLDNHVVLCVLLLLPRFLSTTNSKLPKQEAAQEQEVLHPPLFYQTIDPPLEGHICRIEAQEHYIRITTSKEKRMILYRFSDAVRQMPDSEGMQVHRSHWVAYSAMKALEKEGQKVQLQLIDKVIVPVSKSFQLKVEDRFA